MKCYIEKAKADWQAKLNAMSYDEMDDMICKEYQLAARYPWRKGIYHEILEDCLPLLNEKVKEL